MKIRRFTAPDLRRALQSVREALGPEAVILETGSADDRREGVVVLAAAERHPAPAERAPNPAGDATGRETARRAPGDETGRLRDRLHYLSRLVTTDHFSRIPIPLRELYLDLVAAEVDSNLAFTLLERLARRERIGLLSAVDGTELRERLQGLLKSPEPRPGDRAGRVVMLLGPAGAGKTSVTAALAARCLRRGLRPGLVSIDTFRAGGAAALGRLADALAIPCIGAFAPEELASEAARGLDCCDLLLVDTPPLGPGERDALAHVRRFQRALTLPELHLVLPANVKVRDLSAHLDRCARLELSSLIFTRLDETESYGGILSLALKSCLPVTFLGWGRHLLNDLRPATPEELIALVLDPITARPVATPAAAPAAAPRGSAKRPANPEPAATQVPSALRARGQEVAR